jgi:hypothetical protein
LQYAEHICWGSNFLTLQGKPFLLTLYGKPFATYEWTDGDIPIFEFCGENAELWQKEQDRKKEEAVRQLGI